MRIGLFGGTFNPIHNGHLRSAVDVQISFGLETVYFIPAAVPPHKGASGIVDARLRMQMARLAIEGRTGLAATDVELLRAGPSFTIDTISHFQAKFSHECELFFIVGQDAFLEIDTWRQFQALFANIEIIVMTRPTERRGHSPVSPEQVEQYLQKHISGAYSYEPGGSRCIHPSLRTVHLSPVTLLDISASRIRALAAARRSIRFLTPKSVEDFIHEKGLYR